MLHGLYITTYTSCFLPLQGFETHMVVWISSLRLSFFSHTYFCTRFSCLETHVNVIFLLQTCFFVFLALWNVRIRWFQTCICVKIPIFTYCFFSNASVYPRTNSSQTYVNATLLPKRWVFHVFACFSAPFHVSFNRFCVVNLKEGLCFYTHTFFFPR